MSKVGQVYYASNRRAQFLNLMPESTGEYSEATAERIDQEISEIISAQYARALGILKDKRGALEKSVTVLLEKETIEGPELKTLMTDVAGGKSAPAATVDA
jgi:cell division protease FtsH